MKTDAPRPTDEHTRRTPVGTPVLRPRGRDVWLFVVGLAIFWLIFSGPPVDRVADLDLRFGQTGPAAANAWKWTGALLLVALVLWGEKRRLASMLIVPPSGKDLEWVLYAFGGVMTWSWLVSLISPQENNQGIEDITSLGVPGALLLIVTAAVTEEVAYRGYLQERVSGFLRSRWLGAALSLVVFVAPHVVFFGPSWLLHQFPATLALVAIALFRRNLVAAVVLHLLVNLPILIPTIMSAR